MNNENKNINLDYEGISESLSQKAQKTRNEISKNNPEIIEMEKRLNSKNQDESDHLKSLIKKIELSPHVDISDFPIPANTRAQKILLPVKQFIWKFLGFYTYRLFIQQNQINGQLSEAVKLLNKKVEALEKKNQ